MQTVVIFLVLNRYREWYTHEAVLWIFDWAIKHLLLNCNFQINLGKCVYLFHSSNFQGNVLKCNYFQTLEVLTVDGCKSILVCVCVLCVFFKRSEAEGQAENWWLAIGRVDTSNSRSSNNAFSPASQKEVKKNSDLFLLWNGFVTWLLSSACLHYL